MVGRFGRAYATAAALLWGAVLGWFRVEVAPLGHLWRPLLVAGVVAAVIAAVSLPAGRDAPVVAALLCAAAFFPTRVTVLVAAMLGIGVILLRLRGVSLGRSVATAAVVFAAVGFLSVLPLVEWGTTAPSTDGDPTYLVLLDGYPRADTLADVGVDISGFVGELEVRGFRHYPDARSDYGYTHRVLTDLLAGVETPNEYVSLSERRSLRAMWKLPAGFVAVAPPVGHVTIPGAVDIGYDGITDLEAKLVTTTALGLVPGSGKWLMDRWRNHVEADMLALEETAHTRVFAHLMVPHVPFLYGPDGPAGPHSCWPCSHLTRLPSDHPNLAPTVEWLNGRLVQIVDDLLEQSPDASIVLFSDHGNRFTDVDEDLKVFLAVRSEAAIGKTPSNVEAVSHFLGPTLMVGDVHP